MKPSLFQRLKTLVCYEIDAFEQRLKRLRSAHFPSDIAVEFVQLLSQEILAQQEALAKISSDYSVDQIGAGQRLQSEHRKLVARLQLLSSLENAETQAVPWSLVPSIERIAADMIPDRRMLTTSIGDLNYGIRWYSAPKSSIQKFLILELPAVHRTNTLLHVLVGHEFFHPLLEHFFAEWQPKILPKIRDSVKEILEKSSVPKDLFFRQRLDELVEYVRQAWKRALEELMCDMGCAAVFGPAALFAMLSLALGSSFDEMPSPQGQFYPPWRYRLRVAYRYGIEKGNGQSSLETLLEMLDRDDSLREMKRRLQEELEVLRELVDHDTDIRTIEKSQLLKIAYDEVGSVLDEAWQSASDLAKNVQDAWTAHVDELPIHLHNLEMAVPPSEMRQPGARMGTPSTLSAIALAAWMAELKSVTEESIGLPVDLRRYKRLCRLMLKAFEDVELKRYFDSQQSCHNAIDEL